MKAIVLGARGYLGKALCQCLLNKNCQVYAISRKKLAIQESVNLKQICLDVSNIHNLLENKEILDFCQTEDVVFYNLVWKGESRLKDGKLEDQFKNAQLATNCLKVASQLKCKKYINVSSQDEAIFNLFVKTDKWKVESFSDYDLAYSAAKLATKNMCLIEAYLNKIDFINTRFSVILDSNLSANNFITSNIKKILNNQNHATPSNNGPIEINSILDIAEAYYYIGLHGKNKADYYIGQGNVTNLKSFFKDFENRLKNKDVLDNKDLFDQLTLSIFDNSSFLEDTSFKFKHNLVSIIEDIIKCDRQ